MAGFPHRNDRPEPIPKGISTLKGEIPYRPDIDGLRAVAVLLVLLSHLQIPHLLGGFIGVDIFFVISGYLITGNIARLIAHDKFFLADFYARRFRRILPALFAMLIGTSLIGYLLFLPKELTEYGRSLLAAFFSYSNLYLFWTGSGYFGVTYTHILLHTWSLGVEEQFYLFIPLFMLAVAKKPRLMRWGILGIGAISFLLSSYFALRNSGLSFYMPYTRAWELLAGALISLEMLPIPSSPKARELLAGASIALIAMCAALYKPSLPFPGITAIPPCTAAVLLLLVGETGKTSLNKVLTWRPLVFIGLISYSLYLWHWPVVVVVRLGAVRGIRENTWPGYLFISLFSILLAALSWRFVERPFRTGQFRTVQRCHVFASVGVCSAIVIAFAGILQIEHGFPARFPPSALAISQYMEEHADMRVGTCFVEDSVSHFDRSGCLQKVDGKKNILLFGDSHAAALWWGLKEQFPEVHFLQATLAACPPTEGLYRNSNCSQMRRFIYTDFLAQNHVDGVVLTERWTSRGDVNQIGSALRFFQDRGIPVTVVGPIPEYSAPLPYLLALGRKWQDPELPGRNRVPGLQQIDQLLKSKLRGQAGITYTSPWDAICSGESCAEYANGEQTVPLLSDIDHLTNLGSVNVAHKLKEMGAISFSSR